MDRAIPQSQRRAQTLRRRLVPVAILAAVGLSVWYLLGFVRPHADLGNLRTDTVRVDSIESTIGAIGTVIPRHEQIVVSPADSRVTQILQRVGSQVQAGDPILRLDDAALRTEVSRLDDRIALQQNAMAKARLELENQLEDLRTQAGIKALELESFTLELRRNRALRAKGLVTLDELRRSETDSAKTFLEITQLERRVVHEEKSLVIDVERLDLEIAILRQDRAEAAENLRRATAPATTDGVVTWVLPREGAAVQRGTELARVADLSAFAVEAKVAASHADQVREGLVARVRVGEERLQGRVARVEPTIEQGVFTVEVVLDSPDHPALRHNARVDVEIVVAERPRTLVVRRGTIVRRDGEQFVFVVDGDRALRTPIRLGVSNLESTEIVDGLAAGDVVVLSDMTRHANNREVLLK